MRWALLTQCSPGAKLVLTVIADYEYHLDGTCIPSIASIAKRSGFTETTVYRHLAELKSRGLLFVRQRGTTSSSYTFALPPENQKGDTPHPPENRKGIPSENREGSPSENRTATNRVFNKVLNKERSRPKTVDQVAEYFASIGVPGSEAEKFFDHYESNGWVQGRGKPIKDWKAAARNWKKRMGTFTNDKRSRQSIEDELLSIGRSATGNVQPVVSQFPKLPGQPLGISEPVGGTPAGILAASYRESDGEDS